MALQYADLKRGDVVICGDLMGYHPMVCVGPITKPFFGTMLIGSTMMSLIDGVKEELGHAEGTHDYDNIHIIQKLSESQLAKLEEVWNQHV